MALTLKNLYADNLPTSETLLYGFASSPPSKTALVKNIIITNTNGTSVTANIKLLPANVTAKKVQISPVNVSIPPNSQVILDAEITMNLSILDQILGNASAANVNCIINGLERDI